MEQKRSRHIDDQAPDAADAAINARLTKHLMDHAVTATAADVAPGQGTFIARVLVSPGLLCLAAVLGIYTALDRKQGFL